MKKILLIAFAVLLFVGCSKDDDNDISVKKDQRLVGTKWQTRATAYEFVYGGVAYDVFEFLTDSTVANYTTKNGNKVDVDGVFKYTLSYPLLSIKESTSTQSSLEFTFKDEMTIVRTGANENLSYMKYIKQ